MKKKEEGEDEREEGRGRGHGMRVLLKKIERGRSCRLSQALFENEKRLHLFEIRV